jgi:hypothetical protein
MQYIIDYLELWWDCLTVAMKDRSLAFPISIVIGVLIGTLFWWLATQWSKLWNKRYQVRVGLQMLCGFTLLLTVVFTVTFASSKKLEEVIKFRLQKWRETALGDQDWTRECFCDAWDAVAKLGHEPTVRLSPSPRTDPSLHVIAMSHAESKTAVGRTYATKALKRFKSSCPYLATILKPATEIAKETIDASMLSWFMDNPGQGYPLERGMGIALAMLQDGAKHEVDVAATYISRMSIGLFLIIQVILFVIISLFAHQSNRPASVTRP